MVWTRFIGYLPPLPTIMDKWDSMTRRPWDQDIKRGLLVIIARTVNNRKSSVNHQLLTTVYLPNGSVNVAPAHVSSNGPYLYLWTRVTQRRCSTSVYHVGRIDGQ